MDASDIDKIFDKMRKAGHGSLIKFDAAGTGVPIEGIIFEPGFQRPPGFESGIFVTVPNDRSLIYYFDPDASKEQGRIIIQKLDTKKENQEPEVVSENDLREFEHIRNAPDVKLGGGAIGQSLSKYKAVIDLEK